MLENTYKTMNEKLFPSPLLISETLRRMETGRKGNPTKKWKRFVTAAFAAALVLTLSVTALASAFPGFRELLFGKQSPVAESLNPVAAVSEEDGLRLEVLGAMGNEKGFTAYFTLRDTAGKGRVTAGSVVSPRAQLNGEYPPDDLLNNMYGGMVRKAEAVGFDSETDTALYRFTMLTGDPDDTAWFQGARSGGAYNAENARAKLSVDRIVNSQPDVDRKKLDLSLFELSDETTPVAKFYQSYVSPEALEGISPKESGFLTPEEYSAAREKEKELLGELDVGAAEEALRYQYDENGTLSVLTPGEPVSIGGGAAITKIGFLGGRLHIQLRHSGSSTADTALYCTDKGAGISEIQEKNRYISASVDGSEAALYKQPTIAFSYFDLSGSGEVQWGKTSGERYQEYVFDISPGELDDYDFYFSAYRHKTHRAQLTATFDLTDSLPAGGTDFGTIECGGISIDKMSITPIGVILSGKKGDLRGLKSIRLWSNDASYPLCLIGDDNDIRLPSSDEDELTLKLTSTGAPIPVEEITAVEINGIKTELAN